MNDLQKIYWKGRNYLQANTQMFLQKITEDSLSVGLLSDRDDKRDDIYLGIFSARAKHDYVDITQKFNLQWQFSQSPLNICVFASAGLGSSYQEGIRFSIQFYVKMARHLGMITGNGFSYLKAARKIEEKYGRLPYIYMPDEINGQSWEEYSKYDITEEQLAIAAQYKTPRYRRVLFEGDAIELLENGYALFTGNNWFSGMNKPVGPKFLIQTVGRYIGGHAWFSGGYRATEQEIEAYLTLQTFGVLYGDHGKAWVKSLFGKNMFAVYMVEKIPSLNS